MLQRHQRSPKQSRRCEPAGSRPYGRSSIAYCSATELRHKLTIASGICGVQVQKARLTGGTIVAPGVSRAERHLNISEAVTGLP